MAHFPPDAPTTEDHTGHGGHHVFSRDTLLRTFVALVVLTILTVVLGLLERQGTLHFLEPVSVPLALGIAGAKASIVAAFFMGLKYDKGTNLLAFVGSIVFLAIFLVFTFLDTGFRGTFGPDDEALPIDVIDRQASADSLRNAEIQEQFDAQPLVLPPDSAVFAR